MDPLCVSICRGFLVWLPMPEGGGGGGGGWQNPKINNRKSREITCINLGSGSPVMRTHGEFGQPEVSQLQHCLAVEEDVFRLEISVDDSLGVDMSQPRQDLPEHLQRSLYGYCGI
jgi:hypothetical protein